MPAILADVNDFKHHVERFLEAIPHDRSWTKQFVGIAPDLDPARRAILTRHDLIPEDVNDLALALN